MSILRTFGRDTRRRRQAMLKLDRQHLPIKLSAPMLSCCLRTSRTFPGQANLATTTAMALAGTSTNRMRRSPTETRYRRLKRR